MTATILSWPKTEKAKDKTFLMFLSGIVCLDIRKLEIFEKLTKWLDESILSYRHLSALFSLVPNYMENCRTSYDNNVKMFNQHGKCVSWVYKIVLSRLIESPMGDVRTNAWKMFVLLTSETWKMIRLKGMTLVFGVLMWTSFAPMALVPLIVSFLHPWLYVQCQYHW